MMSQTDTLPGSGAAFRRTWFIQILRAYITVMLPILLVLFSVRVVMSHTFLEFEYNRPDFPPDVYGFTREDRLHYAPFAVDYLLNDAGIEYLAQLQFPNGTSLYSPRELRHMEDVKVVTRAAYFVLTIGGAFYLVSVAVLLWKPRTRHDLASALFTGGVLTFGLIIAVILGAVFAWDTFFTAFHELFFADGTWIFLYSDTLIRLFPERFWFDAALTIGIITIGGALLITLSTYLHLRKQT